MRARLPWQRRLLVAVIASILAFPASSWPQAVEGTTGGSPYDVPVVTDTNGDPTIVETTIVANETDVSIGGGVTAHAYTFNDTIPGPEFRLTVGRGIGHFKNAARATSSIGMACSFISPVTAPLSQSVNRRRRSLDSCEAPWRLWYHPHHEFSTPVFKGCMDRSSSRP